MIALNLYEFGFCNSDFILQKTQFNFSFCRIFFYILIIAMYTIFKKKLTGEAIETLKECKFKRRVLFAYIGIVILAIVYFIIRRNHILLTKLSLYLLLLTTNLIAILYIQRNHIKNIIIIACTCGLVSSISMELNHSYDESRHLISAYNVSIGNFNNEKYAINDNLLKVPLNCDYSKISELCSIEFGQEVNREVDKNNIAYTPAPYNFMLYSFSGIGMFIARNLRRKRN